MNINKSRQFSCNCHNICRGIECMARDFYQLGRFCLTSRPLFLKLMVGETKMPIYEYVSPSCEVKFEKMRPMSRSNEKADCPECKKESERVLSTFACCSADSPGMTQAIAGSCSS